MILPTEETNHYRYKVESEDTGRIDSFLKKNGFSSRLISYIKRKGQLERNGRPVRFVDETDTGDIIDVYLPEEHISAHAAEGLELDIVYEDSEILVINKPPYTVTHPTKDYLNFTLANYIADYFEKTNQNVKIRFVNRLDRDTTGLIVIAKNKFVHHYIQSRMATDEVKKTYLTIAQGNVEPERARIDLPIYRPDDESIERVIDDRGKPSVTKYNLIERLDGASLIECELVTGRTHQIRVHLKAIGNPIIGDPLYNPDSIEQYDFHRQALHAWRMELRTPKAGKLVLEAPLPDDMMEFSSRARLK